MYVPLGYTTTSYFILSYASGFPSLRYSRSIHNANIFCMRHALQISDFEKLGKALLAVCEEVVEELGLDKKDKKVQSKL